MDLLGKAFRQLIGASEMSNVGATGPTFWLLFEEDDSADGHVGESEDGDGVAHSSWTERRQVSVPAGEVDSWGVTLELGNCDSR